MYLDLHTDAHRRFAAYQTGNETYDSGGDPFPGFTRALDFEERRLGLAEREIEGRLAAAARSSGDSRASLKAQMKAEAARLKLARDQFEQIGIPELQLKQWMAAKQNRIAELGIQLDYLNAYAQYQSSPDTYWLARSFKQGFQKMGNNPWAGDPSMNAMATRQDTSTAPQPQSLQSLVADLTGGTGQGAAPVDQANAAAAAPSGLPGGGGNNPAAAGATDGVSAIQQLVASSPPSPYDGLNDDDAAILHNIERIYSQPGGLAGLPLGTLEGMDPAQRGLLLGGGARLGRHNPSELHRYGQSRWTGGSASAA